MKIVIMGLGTSGDINPLLGIASELKRRGHSIDFLTNDYYMVSVEALNLSFISVGSIEAHKIAWGRYQGGSAAFKHYIAPSFKPSFLHVMNLAKSEKLLVISLNDNYGAAAAAQKYNIPYIKIILSPNVLFSVEKLPAPLCWKWPQKLPVLLRKIIFNRVRKVRFREFIRNSDMQEYLAIRESLGCPFIYQSKSTAILQIGLFPDWFAMKPNDWPANLVLVNFPLFDPKPSTAKSFVESKLDHIGAPIIFTAGSSVSDAADMFSIGRNICESLKIPGLFVGGEQGKRVLQNSKYCHHVDYIDFEFALPKAKLLIHHGGIGTMSQAIRASIPQIIRPVMFDQHDNAHRIRLLGLGTYIMPRMFNLSTVLPIVNDLIAQTNNTALTKRSDDIKKIDAIKKVADIIEEIDLGY